MRVKSHRSEQGSLAITILDEHNNDIAYVTITEEEIVKRLIKVETVEENMVVEEVKE